MNIEERTKLMRQALVPDRYIDSAYKFHDICMDYPEFSLVMIEHYESVIKAEYATKRYFMERPLAINILKHYLRTCIANLETQLYILEKNEAQTNKETD